MKSDPHREILDDLYPAPGPGPDCETLLSMVRAHRATRRRWRQASCLAAFLLAGGAIYFSRDTSATKPPLVAQARQMHQVNDEELFDMLDGQPAAIATLPDGSKRLLLIVNAGPHRSKVH